MRAGTPGARRILCATLLAATAIALPARAAVSWERGSLEQALARARLEHRQVIVDLYADWCGPCREMDERVWSRSDVGEAVARSWLPLRFDGEAGEGKEIHDRYHVVGFPTLLVLAPDGAEIDRVMGFVEARELLATLAAFRAGRGTLAALEKRAAAAHGSDPVLVAELARRHALRGDGRAPSEVEQVVAADPDNRAGRAAPALLVLGKYYHLRGRAEFAEAARLFERLVASFPRSPEAGEAPYHLAIAQHGLGDDARALATLEAWLAASPRDEERINGFAWCCAKYGFARARAIAVARAGVASSPRADALWDTLATLLADEGRVDEALAAERAALALQPADHRYQTQLERIGGTR